MSTTFRAALFCALMLTTLAKAAPARAEWVPLYEGELATDSCAARSDERYEPRERAMQTWLMATRAPGLIDEAVKKADDYIAKECASLYHGKLSKGWRDYLTPVQDSYCQIFHEANGCYSMKCFGYASATCDFTLSGSKAAAAVVPAAPAEGEARQCKDIVTASEAARRQQLEASPEPQHLPGPERSQSGTH